MVLDDVVVDGDAGDGLVPAAVSESSPMFLIVSRTRSAARSIIGSPTCACSKSSSPVMRPSVEHELERVVGDEPSVAEAVRRDVVPQPAAEEHGDRVRAAAPPSKRS